MIIPRKDETLARHSRAGLAGGVQNIFCLLAGSRCASLNSFELEKQGYGWLVGVEKITIPAGAD